MQIETDAIIFRTRLSYKHPVLEQAYQLLGIDVEALLKPNFFEGNWHIEHSSGDDKLDDWIYRYYTEKNILDGLQ